MTNYYFDMDGVLVNFHEHKDGWKKAMNYEFIRNLNPFSEAIQLVNDLLAKKDITVYISSVCASEEAKQAKIEWLAQYIPTLEIANIIITVKGNCHKEQRMKTDNGILVDDKMENIKAWRKQGYKAIFVETKGKINLEKAE